MSQTVNRQYYLNQLWEKYPSVSEKHSVRGRVQSVDLKSRSLQLRGKSAMKLSGDLQFPIEILQENDLVALKTSGQYVEEIVLLAPCLKQFVSSNVQSEVLKKWNQFLHQTRQFFFQNHFLEVQTPSLVVCPGTEPFLDVFSVDHLFLPTSPEIHLKKALSQGFENIFEIRSCFRKGEISDRHQPEFTMLEWYRSYSKLEQIQRDCLDLIRFLSQQSYPLKKISMRELFEIHLQFPLSPETSIFELKSLAKDKGLPESLQSYELWDDVFYHIFVDLIEPKIDSTSPIFVEKYPPSQAALARLTADGWGDRFELYWKGLEIANAFHELNDPDIQKIRFQEDLDKRNFLGKTKINLDSEFLEALEQGMPPSSGIALGVERLFMALNPGTRISDLKVFPYRLEQK